MTRLEWRMIPDSDYEISSLGQVRDSNSGEPPESWTERDGTPYVYISEREFGYRGPVWKLMLAAFFRGNIMGVEVLYLDGLPRNVELGNLGWYFVDPRTGENRPIKVVIRGNMRHLDRRVGRKVQIMETGQVFDSVQSCAEAINGQHSNIYACLSGRNQSHRGYTFRYV